MSGWTRKTGVLIGIVLIAATVIGVAGTEENNIPTEAPADIYGQTTYIDATGTVELTCETQGRRCKGAIAFDEAGAGSELRHLRKKGAFGTDWQFLDVMLTSSFLGEVGYEKRPEANAILIHGEQAGEVSYQLVAPVKEQDETPKLT